MRAVRHLILFARRPSLGCVKTRLEPALGPESVLRLYRGFLIDQIGLLHSLRDVCNVELSLDEPWEPDAPVATLLAGIRRTVQGPGDLGRRLLRAVERSHRDGYAATVLIGADSPTLPRARVIDAFSSLEHDGEAVISPARDGGFVLIGMRRPFAALFEHIPWGGDRVLEATRNQAARAKIDLREIPGWYDVDDAVGLQQLRADLTRPADAERAPATVAALAQIRPAADR